MVHRHEIKVRFYELDPYNHVNHSSYIQYFEVARVEFLEQIGFGLDALARSGVRLVVTGIETRFLRSAGPGDRLTVETEVGVTKRATATWHQRMTRGDEVVATQTVGFAATDVNGKPIRFPADLLGALAGHSSEDA